MEYGVTIAVVIQFSTTKKQNADGSKQRQKRQERGLERDEDGGREMRMV